ncbi:hypothetical protein I4F81_005751 [Pyropia yezoensis]|uniref:Uncharacterized protein n=1 Tax=Pyropia yezoensis TaxID=2788 RepID=A0ACC3BZ10_PYRYE|nr:hypothetical protein I4F81_005751 [Neopyropia yezoensis]
MTWMSPLCSLGAADAGADRDAAVSSPLLPLPAAAAGERRTSPGGGGGGSTSPGGSPGWRPPADVSVEAGIPAERALKYGGPCVADLDGDGWADAVLLNHHRSPTRVLWGGPGGRLAPGPDLHPASADVHGVTAAVLSGGDGGGGGGGVGRMTVVVARGGGWGHAPRAPWVLRPRDDRSWEHLEGGAGLQGAAARGRSPRLLDPTGGGVPELLLINYRGRGARSPGADRQLLYTPAAGGGDGSVGRAAAAGGAAAGRGGGGPVWARRRGSGFEGAAAEAAVVVTLPDGASGLVTFPWLRFWATRANGTFADVTAAVMGTDAAAAALSPVAGVAAVHWGDRGGGEGGGGDDAAGADRGAAPDLYLTRSAGRPDVLLAATRGGRYTDASTAAGVAGAVTASGARGVAVADYNNDGEEDVYVVATASPRTADTLLLGTGRGRPFRVTRVAVAAPLIGDGDDDGGSGGGGGGGGRNGSAAAAAATTPRGGAPGDVAPGDGVAALDADADGWVDVLLGDGDQDEVARAGVWRLLRNTPPSSPPPARSGYLARQ